MSHLTFVFEKKSYQIGKANTGNYEYNSQQPTTKDNDIHLLLNYNYKLMLTIKIYCVVELDSP